MENSILWNKILDKIKSEISSISYQTWFEQTELYELEKGVAKILVPYALCKEHLANHYKTLISKRFIEEIGEQLELEFLIEEEIEEEEEIIKEDNGININSNNINNNENNYFESNLNKKYTFENFIIGNSNRFAQAAALAVAEKPGETYNPLFIYGNSGSQPEYLRRRIEFGFERRGKSKGRITRIGSQFNVGSC